MHNMRAKSMAAFVLLQLFWTIGAIANTDGQRLLDAVKSRQIETARALLKGRVDVNTRQPDGATALHWAAYWDDIDLADRLIRAGANVNAVTDLNLPPLSLACTNKSAGMVAKLLAAGADPNIAPS